MTRPPGNHAVPLDVSVDALSDVLELIHLRGGELTMARPGEGREIRHPAGGRILHIVQQGPVDLGVTGAERTVLEQGDLVLLATGAEHHLRPEGDGAWMSGTFLVEEQEAVPLLAVLPPALVIRGSEAGREWLPLCAQTLAAEIAVPTAGSKVMVSRVLDLLFILALRTWSASAGPREAGWLTAALDQQLGPAMRAIHRHPERPWSVEELAGLASMSRAAFCARFVRLVGEPPARHLSRLRLARAADRLATTSDAVGAIGRTVGYASEAAFSRAFSRAYGSAPRAWRIARAGGSSAAQ